MTLTCRFLSKKNLAMRLVAELLPTPVLTAHTDHRPAGWDGGAFWTQETKAGTSGTHRRGFVHHILMGYVTVGEIDPAHMVPFDHWNKLGFFDDGYPIWV